MRPAWAMSKRRGWGSATLGKSRGSSAKARGPKPKFKADSLQRRLEKKGKRLRREWPCGTSKNDHSLTSLPCPHLHLPSWQLH